jgi:hypothetical protein
MLLNEIFGRSEEDMKKFKEQRDKDMKKFKDSKEPGERARREKLIVGNLNNLFSDDPDKSIDVSKLKSRLKDVPATKNTDIVSSLDSYLDGLKKKGKIKLNGNKLSLTDNHKKEVKRLEQKSKSSKWNVGLNAGKKESEK